MSKLGLSLHIGINSVDPKHYRGWSGTLRACENDARDMALLSTKHYIKPYVLLTKEATRLNIRKAIKEAASLLDSGDLFFITYSGHGGQIPDRNGDEEDHKDETWCLYDGQFIDDEIFDLFSRFDDGVRIIVLSDSCHSGTVIKQKFAEAIYDEPRAIRAMPIELEHLVYKANSDFYDPLLDTTKSYPTKQKIMLISGCQDNQFSVDGKYNGVFTATLKSVWNKGRFIGSYKHFYTKILRLMPLTQTPNMLVIGDEDMSFLNEKIFSI